MTIKQAKKLKFGDKVYHTGIGDDFVVVGIWADGVELYGRGDFSECFFPWNGCKSLRLGWPRKRSRKDGGK